MPNKMPKVYEGDRDYIFVSYSHDDEEAVLPIIDALVSEGYRVWYDNGIEVAENYPDYIADHVYDCACFVTLISNASLGSNWCRQETDYAIALNKRVLPVYLENVELPRGLQMGMGNRQAMFWYKYDTNEAFYKKLFKARRLDSCLSDEGRKRRGVKPKVAKPKASQVSDDTSRVMESGSVVQKVGISEISGSHAGETSSGRAQPAKPRDAEPQPVEPAVARSRTSTMVESAIREASSIDGEDALDELQTGQEHGGDKLGGVEGVARKAALAEYSWAELKEISRAIASGSDAAGLEIAKAYGLVDAEGKLRGDRKPLRLKDGTDTSVRILGFRHDDLVGGGRAGISFEFADVLERHGMNLATERGIIFMHPANDGGWMASEARNYLNSGFFAKLPDDLRLLVDAAVKKTNNRGFVGSADDLSAVTKTEDRLWLLSMSEVYGNLAGKYSNVPPYPRIYDAEGTQYQRYENNGVSTTSYDFAQKDGACSWWWLRSPNACSSGSFHFVNGNGDWNGSYANHEGGVSPAFCF